jgi:hypothetical protein
MASWLEPVHHVRQIVPTLQHAWLIAFTSVLHLRVRLETIASYAVLASSSRRTLRQSKSLAVALEQLLNST